MPIIAVRRRLQRTRERLRYERHEAEIVRRQADREPTPPETWAFRCRDGERRVKAPEYRALVLAQADRPQRILETLEGPCWWMFRDRFYVADGELRAADIVALLHDAVVRRAERLARAHVRLALDEQVELEPDRGPRTQPAPAAATPGAAPSPDQAGPPRPEPVRPPEEGWPRAARADRSR